MDRFLLISIISFLLLAACATDEDQRANFYQAQGKVIDDRTGQAVDSVQVMLDVDDYLLYSEPSQIQYTDPYGTFSFKTTNESWEGKKLGFRKGPYYEDLISPIKTNGSTYRLFPTSILKFAIYHPQTWGSDTAFFGEILDEDYGRTLKYLRRQDWRANAHYYRLRAEHDYYFKIVALKDTQTIRIDTLKIRLAYDDTLNFLYAPRF